MVDHEFGGSWTEMKLSALKSYLEAYQVIFKQNEQARHFKTIYVDAFAGTGERKVSSITTSAEPQLFLDDELPEVDAYRKGSARIALELKSPFDEYIFVDKNKEHADHLMATIQREYPALQSRCQVWQEDGSEIIRELCVHRTWKHQRAVVFLDPYGMNVEWNLLRLIANTQAIDLWFLFPLGMGANRLLKRGAAPPKTFCDKLTRMFGTEDWQTAFYRESPQTEMFGGEPGLIKEASFGQISEFFIERLKTIFAGVAPTTKVLLNSKNNPMYLLCFAAGNPKGAPTAVRIANHLLGK